MRARPSSGKVSPNAPFEEPNPVCSCKYKICFFSFLEVFTLFSSYKRKPTSCLYSTATTTTSASPSTLPRFKQLVSSPHPISQIRLIRYTHFADSLVDPQEKAWRAREEQLQLKHHYFWADNNTRFHSEKTDFEEKCK